MEIEGTNRSVFPLIAEAMTAAEGRVVTQGASCSFEGLTGETTESTFEDPNLVLIERKPNTRMSSRLELVGTRESPHGYVKSYYRRAAQGGPAIVVEEACVALRISKSQGTKSGVHALFAEIGR